MSSQDRTSEPPVRLRPGYYSRPDFFRTDPVTGVTRTHAGTRICALTNDFLIGFRDAVIYETGKSYRRVMKRCGRRWGEQFVKRFDSELSNHYRTPLADLSAGVVHAALAEAFNYHGWGKLTMDTTHLSSGYFVVELRNSMMPELVSASDRPVDLLMAGLIAAIFSHLSGRDLDAVQTACPSQGAEASLFILGPTAKITEVETRINKGTSHTSVPHETILRQLLGEKIESKGEA
jgi:hypothetical protein